MATFAPALHVESAQATDRVTFIQHDIEIQAIDDFLLIPSCPSTGISNGPFTQFLKSADEKHVFSFRFTH